MGEEKSHERMTINEKLYLHGEVGECLTPTAIARRTSGIWVATGREVVTSEECIDDVAKDKKADWPNADARR
jgi:predicted P-loop ATPase